MDFKLLRTMDQVSWLGLGLYFHSVMLVTTSWSCFMPLGRHWFHSQSLLWPPVLAPSHPGPATFSPCWTHSLVSHDSLEFTALMAYFVWIQQPRRLRHCARCTPWCTMIKSVKQVRCQSSLIDRLITSTRRSGVLISPSGSNRMICVGPNCWIISWTISYWNCGRQIWLIGNWRLIWKSPNVCLAIWCRCCFRMWYLGKF